MRITADAARTVSAYAGKLSNGYVTEVGSGSDLGNGARIMDGESQTVWLAKPREAVAYYLGQIDGFALVRAMGPSEYPDEVRDIRAEVRPNGTDTPAGVKQWYETGLSDAASRAQHYCREIRGAGAPRA